MSRLRQTGMLLPALAVLLLVGAIALGVSLHQRVNNTRTHQQTVTTEALGQARALLRDFAQNYHVTHPDQTIGYLPCPDMDGDGSAETDCPFAGQMSVGLFPYRTLGHPPLRDGQGECLWYAVAGTFKNNPKQPAPGIMNWDTPGQFAVVSSAGVAQFTVTRPTELAAALVFSPGPAMTGQSRSPRAGRPCIAAGLTEVQRGDYLEADFSSPGAALISVPTRAEGSTATNDQAVWLQGTDLFNNALLRRDAFVTNIMNAMVLEARSRFTDMGAMMLPPPTSPVRIGDVEIGGLPTQLLLDADTPLAYLFREWRDQFRYLRCVASATVRCMMTTDGNTCRGILLFAGRSQLSQDRVRGLDADLFESNVTALQLPESTGFEGASLFSPAAPHQDLVLCL